MWCALAIVCAPALLQAQTLAWDHDNPSTVSGFVVSVDGVRTDHARRPVASNGSCGCSVTLSLAAGRHTIAVGAYNAGGETWGGPITVDVAAPAPTPPPPPPDEPTLPSPWLTQDIGNVGAVGTAAVSSTGTFTVRGAGADIWGTADAFRFVSQSITGDGTITARVTGMQNTNTYAKAGIMLRDGTAANAPHVLLNLRPNGVIEMLRRGATGSTTTVLATTTSPAPVWLRLQRRGTTVVPSFSRDGSAWTAGPAATLDAASTAHVGLAVCSHVYGTLNQSTFDNVAVVGGATSTPPPPTSPGPTPTTGPVPAPWTNQDVGAVNLSGTATYGNGTFSVTGAGADVWGRADAFHFVSRPFAGDGSVTARVVRLDNTHTYAKAGLMLRGSLDPDAAHVVLDVRPNGAIEFMTRTRRGASTTFIASAGQTPPAWLRLTRTGTRVMALVSADGVRWTAIGVVDVPGLALRGLFVTSHDVNRRNTATFDAVAVTGN
ncbi:MAG: DUF1349 domain-containing protein [Vicinamibacterales bacterium]